MTKRQERLFFSTVFAVAVMLQVAVVLNLLPFVD
jgi:hypothetical protein